MKRLLLLLALAALFLPGCDTTECETSEECPTGKVCAQNGACIEIACNSSLDCSIGHWCNFETNNCEIGCLNDRDCLPSQTCDTEQKRCVQPGCRTTQLDCEFGEYCNTLTGQCYDAGGFYCEPCESSLDCGSDNNWCLRIGGSNQTYCGVDCSANQECPRGYECARVRSLGDVTVGYQCIAACWEL